MWLFYSQIENMNVMYENSDGVLPTNIKHNMEYPLHGVFPYNS